MTTYILFGLQGCEAYDRKELSVCRALINEGHAMLFVHQDEDPITDLLETATNWNGYRFISYDEYDFLDQEG